MENIQIALLVGFVVSMIGVMTPIIKLNTAITKLDTTLTILIERTDEDRKELKKTTDKTNIMWTERGGKE